VSVLTVQEAEVFYGEFQALFGVSISVEQGETVAIIGANGAGKTTLLRTITGEVALKRGQASYQGQSIKGAPPHKLTKLGISMVPEGRKIFPSLSVNENLKIGGYSNRKGPWNLDKVHRLFPVLKERGNYPGMALSGGQQQMLAIGRALMNNPDLLLMDEISLGLAPIVVKELYGVVREIAKSGTTLIIVEQDVNRSLQVADRVYCLLEGRISLQGQPAALKPEQISQAYFGV
jgi:branched-chain amino acid transport system ATP-binding protein